MHFITYRNVRLSTLTPLGREMSGPDFQEINMIVCIEVGEIRDRYVLILKLFLRNCVKNTLRGGKCEATKGLKNHGVR